MGQNDKRSAWKIYLIDKWERYYEKSWDYINAKNN